MIAILAAMQKEADELLKLGCDVKEKVLSGKKFYELKLADKEVVLALTGVGKGSAVLATSILLNHYSIDALLNIGTAGGLDENEEVLDIVVSDSVVQHDFDTSPIDGDEGYGLFFKADENLINIVRQVMQDMHFRAHVGMVASGDQFIAEQAQIDRILTRFPKAICAEMEAGGIAQAAACYNVPFVVIRSLSDIAVKEGSHMDFIEYVSVASERSARFCEKIVASL